MVNILNYMKSTQETESRRDFEDYMEIEGTYLSSDEEYSLMDTANSNTQETESRRDFEDYMVRRLKEYSLMDTVNSNTQETESRRDFEDYMVRRLKEEYSLMDTQETEYTQEDDEDFEDYMEREGTYLSSDSESEDYMERRFSFEVIATDEDGIEPTFKDIKHASRSLGISKENIIKCCMNLRGYEYITVNDKKYTLSRI